MRLSLRAAAAVLLAMFSGSLAFASAYNGRPKLVVIVVIDQFRADYLERFHDQFADGGFRLFLDRGAVFTDCYYNYANTRTAPGHATLLTGAYSNGHGILANEWWDPKHTNPQGKAEPGMVTSVWDARRKFVGIADDGTGAASPHNLLASTLGDELKLATQGKSRVYTLALKDRAAILTGGYSADGAYWIDHESGAWITSDYYRSSLPAWAQAFNQSKRAEKYRNLEWKDANGKVLRVTTPNKTRGSPTSFYEVVGQTPYANEYEFEFARELVSQEKLGDGPATDLLVVSLSANDIVGHQFGPDSPELQAMAIALDRELADFFGFLGRQVGLANLWIALSADHGVAPLPSVAQKLRIPAQGYDAEKMKDTLNARLSARFSPKARREYVVGFDYPLAWLNDQAFASAGVQESAAEHAVGEALKDVGLRGYYTRKQLAEGDVPRDETGLRYLHSYAATGGWYVLAVPAPFTIGITSGTDHASPFTYDRHVPLAFYGLAFSPGTYRTHAEPVDLATTLASLLGINAPTHAVGRVLTEALAQPRRPETGSLLPLQPSIEADTINAGAAGGTQ
jgi:predicted AlkP superfamily pyrophosphatase or phosphodiesterase